MLRRIAARDVSVVELVQAGVPNELDYRACGIAQIAALIGTGGSLASYGRATAIAQLGGATDDEIVAVLVAVAPIGGLDRSAAEVPALGLALGYDVEAQKISADPGRMGPAVLGDGGTPQVVQSRRGLVPTSKRGMTRS